MYVFIFPEPATRKERLEWLFEKNLLLQNAEKNTWIMTTQGAELKKAEDIMATVSFLASAEKKSTVADYIRKGLLAMPFKFGFRAFRHLLKANQVNEEGVRHIAAGKPYWYLSMVAVAENHRKKGIASRLIGAVIGDTASAQAFQNGYTAILLSTQLESNISLYKWLGFTTISFDNQDDYTIWFMKKDLTGEQSALPLC